MKQPAPPDRSAQSRPVDAPSEDAMPDPEPFSSDPIDIEAATWAARARGGLDPGERARLDAWLSADPRHRAAYREMTETFGRLQEAAGALKAGMRPARAAPGRRKWLAGVGRLVPQATAAAMAFGAVGGGWLGWEWWHEPRFVGRYATARGELRNVALPDGSYMDLDTATQATVRLFRNRREAALAEGQVLFEVAADPRRPFHVVAGGLRITVVGTRFVVRHTGTGLDQGETRVAVEAGTVQVAPLDGGPRAAAHGAVLLRPGQSVVADRAGRLGAIAAVAPGGSSAWRAGRVGFNGVRLDQAIAEFERYGATGLAVRDPEVAALRVGGSFSLRNAAGFARTLPVQLPVRLERRDGGLLEIVAAR